MWACLIIFTVVINYLECFTVTVPSPWPNILAWLAVCQKFTTIKRFIVHSLGFVIKLFIFVIGVVIN